MGAHLSGGVHVFVVSVEALRGCKSDISAGAEESCRWKRKRIHLYVMAREPPQSRERLYGPPQWPRYRHKPRYRTTAEGREHSCVLPVDWTQSTQDICCKLDSHTKVFCAVECADKL